MAKKVIKIISIILIVIAITSLFQTQCFAAGISDVTEDVDFWEPTAQPTDEKFLEKVGNITGIIRNVGTAISLITLIAIGLKFMTGSVEQKAEYKQTLIPWIVGAGLIFAVSNITTILYEFAKGII